MSREKQIAEICEITSNACCIGCEETPFVPESSGICDYLDCRSCKEARLLLNAGYRKQSDVAREIFDDIEGVRIRYALGTISKGALNSMLCYYKEKYTEGKT